MPNGRAQKNDRAEGDVFKSAPAFATFERDLLKFVHDKYPDTFRLLAEKAELTKDVEEKVKTAIQEFKKTFKA